MYGAYFGAECALSDLEHALTALPFKTRLGVDPDNGSLVGARCQKCSSMSWPAPSVCSSCGSGDLKRETVPRVGLIETWTKVWVPVRDISAPYFIARARFGDCPVFGRVHADPDAQISVRTPVRLCSAPEAEQDVGPNYWFEVDNAGDR